MAIVKVIEIIASSPLSFDDAVASKLKKFLKRFRNIDLIWVQDQKHM
jgi:flavin-binding protein dodecin